MKLILVIVSNDDSSPVMKELLKQKFFCTKLSSSGGFLKHGNTTLMIGAEDNNVDRIVEIVSKFSKTRQEIVPNSIVNEFGMYSTAPLEVTVGGGTIFIMDVEKFIKL